MDSKVAGRYAKSLLELAVQKSLQDTVFNDMQLVTDTADASRDLSLLMKNPIVNHDKKVAVIKALFENKVNELSMSFMLQVINKGREFYLVDTSKRYISLYKTQKGIEIAHLTTAIAIDDNLRAKIHGLIQQMAPGKSIEVVETVKPDIIGGFVLKVGDRQFDTRVTKKINELKMQFEDNLYLKDY
ncbi:MAG: ATP synthase F1 subunit delta [Bacteroidia bacterium]|nr:ATP synthase F1 subunit delta [Bacteroidia bacterium]